MPNTTYAQKVQYIFRHFCTKLSQVQDGIEFQRFLCFGDVMPGAAITCFVVFFEIGVVKKRHQNAKLWHFC